MEAKPAVKFSSIDEYIAAFPELQQQLMARLRQAIKAAAPKATEVISYNMPAFKQHGVLVYFAAYKNHIGFYPTATLIAVFAEKLKPYKTSRGAIRFPLETGIPVKLVQDIVRYRASADAKKAARKKAK
jgi:uncharacterized protein YdhG (YjbR/CyaY superfamily)